MNASGNLIRNCLRLPLQAIQRIATISLNQILYCLVAWVGFAAIAMSVRKTWFAVPVAPPTGVSLPTEMIDRIPGCTIWFQAAIAVLAIMLVATWVWRRQWALASTLITSLMIVILLSYPYFVTIRSPETSADAAWLQAQHNNLTWLGGDIYANAEYANKGWKAKTYLVDMPRQLAVVNLPSWSPWEIGLHRIKDLLQWLGYSNAYCQFVHRGWALGIIGASLLFIVSLQRRGELQFNRAGFAMALFTVVGGAAMVAGWSLPFRASQHIRQAAEYCSDRNYAASLAELDRAVALLPVLNQDTYYVAQRGLLDRKLGIESEYSRLQQANGLESAAQYDQAYVILEQLSRSNDPAIRREALRGVMRFAIQDYNCARFELSADRFGLVLRQQPCNVKLIYLMQLQAIRESRVESVSEMRDWMYEASGHLNFATKKVLRASSQQHYVVAAGMNANATDIWNAQRKAKRP